MLHIGLADNKNLERHAEALAGLKVHLRIIGEPSTNQVAMLEGHGIEFSTASKLSEEELQEEYAAADVLLFCSTLEGYGMPIIEAQTIGVPVVTSDRSPMRETAGDGAVLANPDDAPSIREAVLRVLKEDGFKAGLVAKGHINAAACSAEQSAQLHAELYRALMSED